MRGQILNGTQLSDIYEGLKLNGINNYSHILTGIILNYGRTHIDAHNDKS